MENRDSAILVSVACATYNQKAYIRKCIEGFLIQKTNFPFEILIHDDASTDGTAEIVREYEAKYPELIKPIYQTENQYSKGVKISPTYQYPRARGKYIALCEGDDYWTDPLKLQKQVDFLEAHPEYGMCYTQCVYYRQNAGKFDKAPWGGPNETQDTLLYMNTIPTLTALFRSDLLHRYLSEIRPYARDWQMGDYPMWLYFASESKIKFMDFTSGVYRVLSHSASHASTSQQRIRFIDSTLELQRFYIERYGIHHRYSVLARGASLCKLNVYAKSGEFLNFFKTWLKTVARYPVFVCNGLPYAYFYYFLDRRLSRKHW